MCVVVCVCVCVCVHVFVFMFLCMCVCVCIIIQGKIQHTHVCMCVWCVHVCVCITIKVLVSLCVNGCLCVCVCVYLYVCVWKSFWVSFICFHFSYFPLPLKDLVVSIDILHSPSNLDRCKMPLQDINKKIHKFKLHVDLDHEYARRSSARAN